MIFSNDQNFQSLLTAIDEIEDTKTTKSREVNIIPKKDFSTNGDDFYTIDFKGFKCQISKKTKTFFCKFENCPVSFPTYSRILRHAIIHTGIRPFKCLRKECERNFSRKDNMMQHYRNFCFEKDIDKENNIEKINNNNIDEIIDNINNSNNNNNSNSKEN